MDPRATLAPPPQAEPPGTADAEAAAAGGFGGRFTPRGEAEIRSWHAGEVHNAAALGRELGLPSAAPLQQVLQAGWRRWADGLWGRLDGIAAVAIADADRLFLYRDASGLQPLYLDAGRGGEAGFGTELGRLVRQRAAPPRISRPALHEYLRLGDVAAPRTLYEDVVAVRPGWRLCWSARGVEARPAAAPAGAEDDGAPVDFAAAADRLEALLADALRARLHGAERPAAFLSGGVDSALLCALGARQRPDLTTLTVGFDGPAFDESAAARRIAGHLGLRHEVLHFDRGQCLAALARLGAGAQQPSADPAGPCTLLAFEHCRGRFDALLDGTGADEAVGVMPPRHVRVAVAQASLLPGPLRRALARLLRASPGLAGYARLVDFEHPAELMIRWHGFTRAEVQALCGEPVSFEGTHFYGSFAQFPRRAHFARYAALLDAMPSERLAQAMQIGGQAVRLPYCGTAADRHLRRLPVDFRHRPGQPKRILRELLGRHVPAALWDTPKHGFDFPLHEFLAADGHALVRQHLDPGRCRLADIVSRAAVADLAARYLAGESRLVFRIWQLVLLESWLQQPNPPDARPGATT